MYHPRHRDNGYVLTFDGLRIYVAGDTEDIPELKELKEIDVAFLPVNQPYTMTVDQAARAARMFSPKVLYPYHYGSTAIDELPAKLKGSGVEVHIRQMQ
jgi:L-ascorbate metabolism protein UlaG (beta-lactamase superfamily)